MKSPESISSATHTSLSPDAPEFVPSGQSVPSKPKKTKETRAAPRRRRRKKTHQKEAESDISDFDLDTSDLVEKRSQSSGHSGHTRRHARERVPSESTYTHSDTIDFTDWLSGLIGIQNNDHFSLTEGLLTSQRPSRDGAPGSSEQWLDLQAEWVGSKQYAAESELAAEDAERKKWSAWAMHAAETERRRRMLILEEIDKAEAKERLKRQRWAVKALEQERNERISTQFLANLTSTNWFNETISQLNITDYEVVCPYYKLGCRAVVKKTNIQKHMTHCKYAIEVATRDNSEILAADYEVVCPNCVLGCSYIGGRQELHQHLEEGCAYRGKSTQQENEERRMLKEFVISECEEERVRRVNDNDAGTTGLSSVISHTTSVDHISDGEEKKVKGRDEKAVRKASLQRFMETQMQTVVTSLHDEVVTYWRRWTKMRNRRRRGEEALVDSLRCCVRRIWPFATLEAFGSWATGLPGLESDVDLVVCFSDECVTLPTITGVIPLLQGLANFLEKDACDIITIKKVLLHTRVPLIKAEANIYTHPVTGEPMSADSPNAERITVSLDISIDGPEHSGLATTAVTQFMLNALPGIGPVSTLIKEYLKSKGLCDAYTGGLPSYGIVLLVLLLFLRRYQASRLLNNHSGVPSSSLPPPTGDPLTLSSTESLPQCQLSTPPEPLRRGTAVSEESISFPSRRGTPARRQSEGQMRVTDFPRHRYGEPYSWTGVEAQREYGKKVAAKLLEFDGDTAGVGADHSTSEPTISDDSFQLNAEVDQLPSPILGVIVVEFLDFYGEALECGRHGFSVRDGGFRFEVHGSGVAHPQACHPFVIEDPVNVMNNVAKNCYNAACVQRAFQEANDRFKNFVIRYSGRVGSALANSYLSSGGSVITEMFSLSLHDDSSSVFIDKPGSPVRSISGSSHISADGPKDSQRIVDSVHDNKTLSNGTNNEKNLRELPSTRDVEYRRAFNDMLLSQFSQFSRLRQAEEDQDGTEDAQDAHYRISKQRRGYSM